MHNHKGVFSTNNNDTVINIRDDGQRWYGRREARDRAY